MVVCKFFLQGTCKFGYRCNFEHQVPGNHNYTSFTDNNHQSTSVLRQASFGNTQTQPQKPTATTNVDINTLIKSVAADMTGAEKGGQWLLSSYSPFKEKPHFPGFDDQSPEEIRFGFYEAQKTGTLEQYKANLQMLLQSTMMKIKALQNPSPEIINILQGIYNTSATNSSGTFGQTSTTSSTGIFGQTSNNVFASPNKPSFGQDSFQANTQQNTNIFATASKNIFGTPQATPPQNNIFGNAASSNQNQNVFQGNTITGTQNGFLNQQPNNIFANPNQTNNIFKPSNPPAYVGPQQNTNIFASPTQPQNIFATTPNQATMFQPQQNQLQAQNIFATQNQGASTPQQNIFNSNVPQQQNIFSANLNVPTNAPVQQNLPPPNYSASIFGNAHTNSPLSGGFATQQSIDESLYSKLEELTDEDKKWFESDMLDIHNIPDKPPTYEMCFKS